MPIIRTGYSCPLCKRATGETNEVIAEGRLLKCSKVTEHIFQDSGDFMDMNPTLDFQQKQEAPRPQENQTNLNVMLSVPVYNALLAKYGDKLGATATGALKILVEGAPMVISESDVDQIGQVPGMPEKPKNARHLIGLIFALGQAAADAKAEAERATADVKAYEGMAPGRVVIDLGGNFGAAAEKAKGENLPTKVWLEQRVAAALADNWW